MSQTHQPLNEMANRVQLPRYSHPINHRHDFTPGLGELRPVKVVEMFPGRKVSYNVNNVLQLMPLAGDCKQDMYMYTETVFEAWHSVWAKWSLFRYGKLNPTSTVEVPLHVPHFTIEEVLALAIKNGHQNKPCPYLAVGSLLDTFYGITNLLSKDGSGQIGNATTQQLRDRLPLQCRVRPINGLYLRAFYHHYLINHTNEWLNTDRGNMVNDEYPYRNVDNIEQDELERLLTFGLTGSKHEGKMLPVLHERDYFTASNPSPQKGAAVQTVSGMSVQDLTKAIHQQDILDKDADAGTSHYEAIVARYGVVPRSLGNLRPVSAGNPTRQVISINPIFNQAGDTVAPSSSGVNGVNFQGDISGRGFSADGSHHVSFEADVDGCLITCIYIRPETIYHQGLDPKFMRIDRNQFFEPAMITDGDEPIFDEELVHPLMVTGDITSRPMVPIGGVFGYRNKYSDFIYAPSRVSGEFRTTMKHWSMHRDFANLPSLNDEFVRAFDTPTRLFSYEGQASRLGYPRFICYMQFQGQINDTIPNYTKREI